MNKIITRKLLVIALLGLALGTFIIIPRVSSGAFLESKINFTAVFSDGFYWAEGISGSLGSINPASVAPKLKRAFIVTDSTKFINTPRPVGDEPVTFKLATVAGYYDEQKYKVFVESISIQSATADQNKISKPFIESVAPTSGKIDDVITITGSGFEGENIIFFSSPSKIDYSESSFKISSSNDKTLSFRLPAKLATNLGGDQKDTTPGNYNIQIYNKQADNKSDKKAFLVTSSQKETSEQTQSINTKPPLQKTVGDNAEKINIGDLLILLASRWLLPFIIIALVIISAIWVHDDVKKLNMAGINSFLSPVTWSTLVIILWAIFFPAYLILRFTKYKKKSNIN